MRILLTAALLLLPAAAANRNSNGFVDVTEERGLNLAITAGTPEKKFLVETMTGGVCVFDYDNDGWADIFFVNGTTREHWNTAAGPSDRLFRNLGKGQFQDVTKAAGLIDSAWGMGCATADIDNDGDTDLYVTNFGPNFLYINNGDGTFDEAGEKAGVDDKSWSTGAAFGDYNGDGLVDLYVANYVRFDFDKPAGDPRFCAYRGVTVACGPRGLPGAADRLFKNQGLGRFQDVTQEAGMSNAEHYGFQPLWTDLDGDGDLDIFVANDSTPNYLWINQGTGQFKDEALLLGLAYNQEGREQANMGADVADFDGDGRLDIYSTNFSDDYHVLFRDSGDYYTDYTFAAKIAQPTFTYLGFGALFADFDNDGWLDILAANGHIYPEVEVFNLGSTYHQPNQLFRNQADGTFEEVTPRAGPGFSIEKSTRGAAVLDMDHDGDLDIVFSNLDGRVDLLENRLADKQNYLQIELRGSKSNLDAIGAKVYVTAGGRTQFQELHAGSSYLSDSERMLHFGLGPSSEVDKIVIEWPSGQKQTLKDFASNQRVLVEETGKTRRLY